MTKKTCIAALLAGLSISAAQAAPGDYDPAYDQGGNYGVATLDERVAKLEKKLSGDSQLEMLKRMEQLQSDVLRLRGEVEDLTHQLETVKRQQKDLSLDLDRRLQAATPPPPAVTTEAAPTGSQEPPAVAQQPAPPPAPAPTPAAPAPVPAPAPAAPAPAPTPSPAAGLAKLPSPPAPPPLRTPPPAPTPAPSADSAARQAAYQKGFNVLKEGKYAEAIKEFKGFLAAYPKGEYADNAAYWLAEAHYVNRDLAAARESFRKVVKEFPQAPKIADAQLKLGYIDYDTGQWASARETLGEVIKRYPDSSAAKLAQKRLDKMQQEGH